MSEKESCACGFFNMFQSSRELVKGLTETHATMHRIKSAFFESAYDRLKLYLGWSSKMAGKASTSDITRNNVNWNRMKYAYENDDQLQWCLVRNQGGKCAQTVTSASTNYCSSWAQSKLHNNHFCIISMITILPLNILCLCLITIWPKPHTESLHGHCTMAVSTYLNTVSAATSKNFRGNKFAKSTKTFQYKHIMRQILFSLI